MLLLERLGAIFNRALAWMAGIALVAMMLFAVYDMVVRAFGRPVAGSYEVIGWLSACALALALGYTQLHRGHVSIALLNEHLGARAQAAIELLMSLLSLSLFIAVAWYVARYARTLQATGSLSETLQVVVYPWVYVVAVGSAGLALALLIDVLRCGGRFLALRRGRG